MNIESFDAYFVNEKLINELKNMFYFGELKKIDLNQEISFNTIENILQKNNLLKKIKENENKFFKDKKNNKLQDIINNLKTTSNIEGLIFHNEVDIIEGKIYNELISDNNSNLEKLKFTGIIKFI